MNSVWSAIHLPELDNMEANNLAVTQPRLLIIQCVLYGKYGITPGGRTMVTIATNNK